MKISAKVFTFLTNEQLTDLLQHAVSALRSGERVVSWSSAGTSVSKTGLSTSPETLAYIAGLEIARRKAAGTFPLDELPQIPAAASPKYSRPIVPFKLF